MGIWFRNFGELRPDERCLLRVTAKRLMGRTDIGGRLRVTNFGLQFQPSRFDGLFSKETGAWECALQELSDVHVSPGGVNRLRGNGPAGLRPKIVLEGDWGKPERIVVTNPQSVIASIAAAKADIGNRG